VPANVLAGTDSLHVGVTVWLPRWMSNTMLGEIRESAQVMNAANGFCELAIRSPTGEKSRSFSLLATKRALPWRRIWSAWSGVQEVEGRNPFAAKIISPLDSTIYVVF